LRLRFFLLGVVVVVALAGLPYLPGSPLAAFSAPNVLGPHYDGADAGAFVTSHVGAVPAAQPLNGPATRPLLHPGPVKISASGFWSWALLDETNGQISGSPNLNAVNDTASMIKAWLAADYLRRATEKKQKPSEERLEEISKMIRDSDNTAAQDIYHLNGSNASISRLISKCALTDSHLTSGTWSKTYLSTRDAVRMGRCIQDGRAAGGQWTEWLLNEMRSVRGFGRFGIIQALPADVAKTVSIKNGWLLRSDGLYRINCLAIGKDWVLAVMTRYKGSLGEGYGIATCRSVATQLMSAP
jgi:hypothetical protein